MIVAYRSAKVASVIATFAEQKAIHFLALAIGSQPFRENTDFSPSKSRPLNGMEAEPRLRGPSNGRRGQLHRDLPIP
jgi:hypothetical protein